MKSLPIVLLVVATALAVPLPRDEEAWPAVEDIKCTESRFKVNTIYSFKYEALSQTNVDGTSERGSGLRYRCDVEINVPEPCKLVMSVDKCALRHLDNIDEPVKLARHEQSKDFGSEVARFDVIAHLDNGIVRKVLAHPDEPKHILNIKRGILDMVSLDFQDEDVVESNPMPCISGNCPRVRRVLDRREDKETDVEVTKDLRQCENRPIDGITTSPLIWNLTIADKFISSNQTCNFELEWGSIKRVKCMEQHVLWPFSYDSTRGISMRVSQDLKLSEKQKLNSVAPIPDEASRRVTDLLFEHEEEVRETDPSYATETLKKLVKGSLEEIQMETPQLFSQFVGAIRKLNNESIHELYERAINCPLYYESCQNNEPKMKMIRTFVYDALVQCGTEECFRAINTAIISGEVSKPVADFVMYTMAMRNYPSLTLIEETLRVAFYNRTQSTFLPLSIMINNYWNRNVETLKNDRRLPEEIHNSIAFLSSIIGYDCTMPSNIIDGGEMVEHQRLVFLALKAIGNIGQPALHYDSSFYQVDEMMATRLVKCAENKDVPRNVSLAAVQAMRRFEIQQDIRDPLKRILLRTDEDVELRLASYLMIMRSSPLESDIGDILHMLSTEPIDQVRAFIFSHMDNILESEIEGVRELKNTIEVALNGQDLPEYPRDIRRLSRNIELSKVLNISQFDGIINYLNKTFDSSLFNNTIGQLLYVNKTIGGGIESNLIHNPETYWMRAAMIKTTLNLLGKEWEMIETGIDMQGFEPTLEAMFGPQGFFPDSILGSIFRTIDDKVIKVLKDLYSTVEPHVMDVYNSPMNEIPSVMTDKAKATTDYMYSAYNKMNTKQKRSITDTLQDRINDLTNLLPSNIHENIQNIHEEVSKMPLSPAASMYLRLLGHEVGFVTLDDVMRMVPKVNLSKAGLMEMAMKMLAKAQNGMEYNITKSFVFMDKEFVLPSSIGLPVRCNLNGTTSVSLRLRGKAGLQLPKVYIAGRIAPSGGINMIGSMSAEIPYFTKHAVVANATIYHASRLEGNVTIDGTHMKVNLNNTTPINLLNFSTNFYLLNTTGDMHYIAGVEQDRVEKEMCVPEKFTNTIFGVTPCVSWAYPNASYAEQAPRFPMTGPSSFNVTLKNIDPELKTFTWEAAYKQVKSSAANSKRMIMRRSTTKPAQNIIDTIVIKFSAPGKELKREISSVASFDRSKREFRYNFSIPEADITFFSGILNKTCPKTKVSGYQFVTNITIAPEYNASVSLTLMNATTVDKTNYTVVYNQSIMNVYSSAVAQYVHDPTFMIASANVTYHWDSETALWRQVFWPFTGYRIDPKNYRQDYVVLKSLKHETSKMLERDSEFRLSVLNQNFTVKSELTKDDVYYHNDIMVDFENSYKNMRIVNITAKSEKKAGKHDIKISAERFGHGVFVLWERRQSASDWNNTLTYGYEATKKEILDSFKAFQNQPSVLSWFKESAFHTERISYNVSHILCIRDESVPDNKWQRLVYFNTSFPKPLTKERMNFSLSGRVANETVMPSNNQSYWMEFNTSVPFLWFHNAKRVQFINGKDGIDIRYNDTVRELVTNRNATIDNHFNYLWKTMNATWEFRLLSCFFNYTLNTTMYNSTDSGYVFDYRSVNNNTLLHLFNITHGGNFSIAPRNISLNGAFWHKWIQANMTNVLQKHGPITEFSIHNIRSISNDVREKAMMWDYSGIKMVLEDLVSKTLQSSFNLTNFVTIRTPWMGNVTLDHATHFNFSMINHSMNFEAIRSGCNIGILVNTTAFLNRTRLSAAYNTNMIGNRFYNVSSNMGVVLRKADEGALAVDFVNNQRFITPLGNMSMNGTYNVHNMSRPWRFSNINGTLGYNISTPIVNSTMNSSFIFDNFTHLMRFNGVSAMLDQNITSRFLNWNMNGSFIIDEFRSLVNYSRINGSFVTDLKSCIANASHSIVMDVKNMTGPFRFEKVGGNITQNIDSIFGKSVFTTGVDFSNLTSPFNFSMVNGSINYNMSSRLVNLTMANLLKFENFTKLWRFGKINGTMLWNLNTSLANATLKHVVDFDNFVSPINFSRVNVSLEHEFNSKLTNGSLKQAYGIYGMKSYLTYERANSSIKGEIKTPFFNSFIAHEMDVRDMEGPFKMSFANISLHANAASGCKRFNFTTTNGMEWRNMDGICTFERINGSHIFSVNSPIARFNTFGELTFDDFSTLTAFRMVNATGSVDANSRYLNFTSHIGHEMHNFRSLFNFDRIQTDERTVLRNRFANHTGETHLTFYNFRSLLNFDSINGNLNANTKTYVGEHNQTYTFDLRNLRGLFNFDRLFANANVETTSRWFNMSSNHNLDLDSFQKMFTFNRMDLTSNVDIKTPIVNITNEIRANDHDHRDMFYFNRIFAGHRLVIETPFHDFTTESDVELSNFYKMFQFNYARFNNMLEMNNRFVNFTSNHKYHLDNFRSAFNFDKISTGGTSALSTIVGSHNSNIDISFNNFRSFWDFDTIKNLVESHFVSRHLNNSVVLRSDIADHRAFLNFDSFTGSYNMLFNTKWYNFTNNVGFGVHEVRKLFNFERISTGASMNMSTPIMKTGSMVRLEFNDFRSILEYSNINATAAMNVSSRWLNVSSEARHGIHDMNGLFVFDRMNTNGTVNISTPIMKTNSFVGLGMHNVTKLWQFTRVNGSALMDVSSRLLNFTDEGMFGIHNVTKPWAFERINGSMKMNLRTPIVNTMSMAGVEFNNFTNLFNFSRINGTGSWNVGSRWLNMTTDGDFGFHNFSRIFTFERINGTAKMNLSTPFMKQSSLMGIEFNNFTSLFNFSRINGTGLHNVSSRWLNSTTCGEFGLHNFSRIFTFDRINGSAKMNLSTPFFKESSLVGLEFNNFTSLVNFSRINGTANHTLVSRFLNITGQGEIGFHNFSRLFTFDRLNSSMKLNVNTPIADVSLMTGSEHNNFSCLFNFSRVNYTHALMVRSRMANFTSEGSLGFHNFTGFKNYHLINGSEKINFTSCLMNLTHITAFEDKNHTCLFTFERFNVTSLTNMNSPWHRMTTNTTFEVRDVNGPFNYSRAHANLTTEFITRLVNLTTNSSMELLGFNSLFNFSKANGTFLVNVTTPVANSSFNASLLLDNITSWRLHRGINTSMVFHFRSPMMNSSVEHKTGCTNFTSLEQMFRYNTSLRILEREIGLYFTEKINNDFVLFNVTVPQLNGSLCALAELNKEGDVFNMSLFRQTKENVNITDLNWILMLNRSDVIYSNFTWNPETLRAIRRVSGAALNKTINATLTALNKTMTTVNKTLTVARRAINTTIQAVNYTYNNPLDSLKIVVNGSLVDATIVRINATRMFLNQTLNSTIFFTNQTWQLMNFTTVNSTVESFVFAIKQTPLNVPIQFVNVTIRRMDFSTINSTIESVLSEIGCAKTTRMVRDTVSRVNNSIEILGKKLNETVIFLNTTSTKAIIFFNQKLNESIVFLNETWRDGNFTSMNATIDTIISALNRTRLNSTILLINNTWQQMNFTNLNSTVECLKKVVNFTAINSTINATISRIMERVNLTSINETVFELINMVNVTHLNETLVNYTRIVLSEIERIAKNESHPVNQFTIKHLNTTAYNLTMKYYPIAYNYTYNITVKVYPIVRNFTLHYYSIAQNMSEKYYPVVYDFTVTYYPVVQNYSMIAFNKTKNFTLIAFNLTRCYGEVIYNRSLVMYNRTANYTQRALNLTSHYGVIAFNKTRNYTLWLVNVTRPQRELMFNFTRNMTNLALNKAVNYSLRAIEYTANKTEWAKEHHREYIIYYIEVLNKMTDSSSDTTEKLFNVTEKVLKKAFKLTIKYGKPVTFKLLERSKNSSCLINYIPMRLYNKTLYVIGQEIGNKVMLDGMQLILKEDNTLNTYLRKITDMNSMELGMYLLEKAQEYKTYARGNITYLANVTRSNVTFWTNYTLEHAPMATLNLIGNATVKANTTVLWLNSTREQPLEVTIDQVKIYLNETMVEVIEYLNKTLNGSTERLLNLTWTGFNRTVHYANRTLIYINETMCYVRNTSVKVWKFINEETPLVNMTIDFANKTLNFTLTYANKAVELPWEYARKYPNASYIAKGFLKQKTELMSRMIRNRTKNMDWSAVQLIANLTKNVTRWSIDYTRDYARLGVEYVNGTMAGWFIRYYNIHNIPYNLYNITYTHLNNTPEYMRRMVEFQKLLTVDSLNKIGRLEDNSFAINISHPLNFTSFRKFPNLTNDQWMVINNVTMRVQDYAIQARDYYELAREISEEKYSEARDYVMEMYEAKKPMIDERMNQLKAKYEELKAKVQELRERIPEYREMAMEYREKAVEKYETLKANWPMYKQQMKDKLQEMRERLPTKEEIRAIPAKIRQQIDDMLNRWPETYVDIRSKIIALPAKYLELKSKMNAWIEQIEFNIPMECQKLMDNVQVYPRIHTEVEKICNKIPALRLEAEKKYEELQRYIEMAKVIVEKKLEVVCAKYPVECEQIKQKWEEVSAIDAQFVTAKLQEYIPETWEEAKEDAREQWEIMKVKIEELKHEAEVKIEELKVKVEELKVKAKEMKSNLKVKATEIKDLIKEEYPNTVDHIQNAITEIKNMIQGTITAIRERLVEFFNKYYPTLAKYVDQIMTRIVVLRPVLDKESTAMIFGNLGVFTFDQKLYEFPGYRDPSCTYVLARDFVDRNFTLLADQRAITIVLPSVVVRVDDEHRVFINGDFESSELPYQTENRQVEVVREGPWINVTTKYGITINCHQKHFLCTMKLSSWYHGKTQGLLGTFDREIHNEMRKPDGTNATTIIEWANSYEVTGHSYCKIPIGRNVLPTRTGVCNVPAATKIQQCENFFMDPMSKFAEAFNKISAGPFFEMCNHMARDCLDICDVAHSYVSLCRDEGIMIDHTPICDRCENDISLDTKFNITKLPTTSADIVFVVSENRKMNKERRVKSYITDLVNKMEKTLGKNSIVDNRYSIVAFGGEGVHAPAHTHTSNGKVFATSSEIRSGIESLEFDGEYQTDAMDALQWAADLHWRQESTRVVILVAEMEREEPFNSSLSYLDVQQVLYDNSITLFVFSEYETLNKDGKEPVLGINFDSTLITTKKTSSADLVSLKLPKGHYAKMSTASKGAIFRINMLLNSAIERNDYNAQISKVFRNSINTESSSVTLKACMCSLDKNQCPVAECRSIRQ